MLQEADGPKWREKLPDVKVSHLIQSSQPTATGRPTSTIPSPDTNESFDKPQQTRETKSKTSGSSTAAPKVPELTKDELYDKHKNEGNAFVQKVGTVTSFFLGDALYVWTRIILSWATLLA